MPGYILTGPPGAGKTAILRLLEVNGHAVVEESATDVIALCTALGQAQPWQDPAFLDSVVKLQVQRQDSVRADDGIPVFFDRSPVCTLALGRYLGFPAPDRLAREVERIAAGSRYAKVVFFIRNQGFIRATEARRISFEDSLRFEEIHEQTYRGLGFQLVDVPPGPLATRAALVQRTVEQLGSPVISRRRAE